VIARTRTSEGHVHHVAAAGAAAISTAALVEHVRELRGRRRCVKDTGAGGGISAGISAGKGTDRHR
jgi:hypothetical protein